VAREWCDTPSDIHEGVTLDEYLKSRNIVGICGIDTRRLTRTLRDKGYFNGAITSSLDDFDNLIRRIKSYSIHGAVEAVTIRKVIEYRNDAHKYNIVIIDYGFSRTMLKSFIKRGCNLTIVPAKTSPDEILKYNPDGLIFSDGPGDPDDEPILISNINNLIAARIPSLGIGVGYQMLALATGGRINKMPKGHRGSNQPVRICGTDKVMITSQNHGYDVADGSVSENVADVFLRNVNDNSIEGLVYSSFPGISIQFTPSDDGNYSDSSWIFDRFIELIKGGEENE
ncbi:MAG: carbamoyl phosphate synthase small subunit, partial [Eubacteriales bacterium]